MDSTSLTATGEKIMRLGTETASLVNHLQSRATIGQPVPTVGMGATLLLWTDRHAATVVSVEEVTSARYRHIIVVQQDHCKRVDQNGMSEDQDYAFTPNLNASREMYASLREGGAWVPVRRNEAGRLVKREGSGLRLGKRDEYHDFSF